MGGYDPQTIAGVISTSTHGSGLAFGPLNDFVRSLDSSSPADGRCGSSRRTARPTPRPSPTPGAASSSRTTTLRRRGLRDGLHGLLYRGDARGPREVLPERGAHAAAPGRRSSADRSTTACSPRTTTTSSSSTRIPKTAANTLLVTRRTDTPEPHDPPKDKLERHPLIEIEVLAGSSPEVVLRFLARHCPAPGQALRRHARGNDRRRLHASLLQRLQHRRRQPPAGVLDGARHPARRRATSKRSTGSSRSPPSARRGHLPDLADRAALRRRRRRPRIDDARADDDDDRAHHLSGTRGGIELLHGYERRSTSSAGARTGGRSTRSSRAAAGRGCTRDGDAGSRSRADSTRAASSTRPSRSGRDLMKGDAGLLERFVPFVQYDSPETYAADSVAIHDRLRPGRLPAGQHPERRPRGAGGGGTGRRRSRSSTSRSCVAASYPDPAEIEEEGPPRRGRQALRRRRPRDARPSGLRRTRSTDSPIATPTGELWLQYWLFYYYNDKGLPPLGLHEGDWEMVQLRIGEDGEPDAAAYAQHTYAENCPPGPRSKRSRAARPGPGRLLGPRLPRLLLPPRHLSPGPGHPRPQRRRGPSRPPALTVITAESPTWVAWPGRWGIIGHFLKLPFVTIGADCPPGPRCHEAGNHPGPFNEHPPNRPPSSARGRRRPPEAPPPDPGPARRRPRHRSLRTAPTAPVSPARSAPPQPRRPKRRQAPPATYGDRGPRPPGERTLPLDLDAVPYTVRAASADRDGITGPLTRTELAAPCSAIVRGSYPPTTNAAFVPCSRIRPNRRTPATAPATTAPRATRGSAPGTRRPGRRRGSGGRRPG